MEKLLTDYEKFVKELASLIPYTDMDKVLKHIKAYGLEIPKSEVKVTDADIEKACDEALLKSGYDVTGDSTSDFADGFARACEWLLPVTSNKVTTDTADVEPLLNKEAEMFYHNLRTFGILNPHSEKQYREFKKHFVLTIKQILEYYASQVKASEWVKVEERLPEYYKSVLIKTKNESFAVAWRASDGDNYLYTISGTDVIIQNIVEWKYITPPKI